MGLNVLTYTVRLLFWVLIGYLIYLSFAFTIREPVWGVIDETAHMDYIEKLSNGHFTMNTDSPIENEIFQSLEYARWAKPPGYDGTMHSAGLVSLSYELHQPPLYYFIMAIPNWVMKQFEVSLLQRVMIIRLLSWLLFLMALFIGYFCLLNLLNRFKLSVSVFFAQLYVLFLLLVGSSGRFGISNDWLALILVHSIIWLLTMLYFENRKSVIPWMHALIAALIITKQTYLPLALIFFLAGTVIDSSFYKFIRHYLFYLPVLLWYVAFIYQWQHPTVTHTLFNLMLPAGMFDFKTFLLLIIHNALDWKRLIPFSLMSGLWVLLLYGFSVIAVLYFRKSVWLIGFSMLVLLFLAMLMFALNKWIGGVHWYAYRHFNGYGFFIFVGAFGWLIYVFDWIKLYIQRIIS